MVLGKILGCHQQPCKCPKINGFQFFLCYRCIGLYLGNVLGVITYKWSSDFTFALLVILMLPMIIDGSVQALSSSYQSTNIRRIVTGLSFGVSIVYALVIVLKQLF